MLDAQGKLAVAVTLLLRLEETNQDARWNLWRIVKPALELTDLRHIFVLLPPFGRYRDKVLDTKILHMVISEGDNSDCVLCRNVKERILAWMANTTISSSSLIRWVWSSPIQARVYCWSIAIFEPSMLPTVENCRASTKYYIPSVSVLARINNWTGAGKMRSLEWKKTTAVMYRQKLWNGLRNALTSRWFCLNRL